MRMCGYSSHDDCCQSIEHSVRALILFYRRFTLSSLTESNHEGGSLAIHHLSTTSPSAGQTL